MAVSSPSRPRGSHRRSCAEVAVSRSFACDPRGRRSGRKQRTTRSQAQDDIACLKNGQPTPIALSAIMPALPMRRSTAIALLLLMLATFLAPAALATATNPIPACCRAGGRHHCSAMPPISGGTRVQGQSCPYRKPLMFSRSAAPPRAAETVTLGGTCSILGEFYSAVLVSHRESPYSQRAPPPA